jgi:Ca-activated chloride channel family protein
MRNPTFSFLLLLTACGASNAIGDGDFGATPGGVKDLELARELIAAGTVPPGDAILVEAIFAEHDLPLYGGSCPRTLCLRAAAGLAPEIDGPQKAWAQVGLSSTIDPATWQRPSTTFIFTVDVSGSMSWGGGDEVHPTPGWMARRLLHELTDEIRPDDRVAMVTYGDSVTTVLGLTSGSATGAVHAAIDRLREAGSTNMEAGMRRAYQLGHQALGSTDQVRVIVFTDTQPNVGVTSGSDFEEIVGDAADDDVHTTTLALGLGIGPTVMRAMASLRGANAYSLTRATDIDDFIADHHPWFTTPIAFDLRVDVAGGSGWTIDRGLGFPAAADAEAQGLEASSVFLSKRRGAMLVGFEPPTGGQLFAGKFVLSYQEPDGQEIVETLPFGHDGSPVDERGQWFAQRGTARTTALGLYAEAMHEAVVAYETDHDAAAAILAPAIERFTADAAALGDDDLPVEVALGEALLALILADAPQGTLYGPP